MQLPPILPLTHNHYFSEGIFNRRWFLNHVNPLLLLAGTWTHSKKKKKPTDFRASLTTQKQTTKIKLSPSIYLCRTPGKLSKSLFFPPPFTGPARSCSILHSVLLGNLDFCDQTTFLSLARALPGWHTADSGQTKILAGPCMC